MVDIVISVVGKLAEYTVAPVLRQFGYQIFYKSNVLDLTQKVATLKAKRDGVVLLVEAAKRNSETILPVVQGWLDRVQETIDKTEDCFDKAKVDKATACCNSSGCCPNLKVRHSLSRKAVKIALQVNALLSEGNFETVSCPAPPQMLEYPFIPYYEDSAAAPVKPHDGASSSSATSNPVQSPEPMQYRLPYTKDLLTALQDVNFNMIGVSGIFREIDTVSTIEFTNRMKQKNLFEEVVMVVASQDKDLKRIQAEVAEGLGLKLEHESLEERAERIRALLSASHSKRVLVIVTDVCGILDLEAIGISHVDTNKCCKMMLVSQKQADVFGELGTRTNFKLVVYSTPIGRPVEFPSRILVTRDVMDALTDEEANPIIIYGMGGIGKTTLVKEIGAKAGEVDLFDEIAFAEFTQEPDYTKIQNKLAKDLGLKLEADDDRAAKLRNRLSGGSKKVLVILDNVWTQLDLWKFGIPISRVQNCCKILVSSRNEDIFKEMGTRKCFHIDGLPKDDAWSLFKKMAGGSSIESDPKLLPIAKQVLEECGGLPVAISTVGKALQGKKISSWRNALRELRNACPTNVPGVIKHVYGKIMFSYDCLPSEEARSLFLLCCGFPESEDVQIDLLVSFAIGLDLFNNIDSMNEGRDFVQELVDTLISRSMLLQGLEKECVRMHDVVRDVAMYIASEDRAQRKNDKFQRRIVVTQGDKLKSWQRNNNLMSDDTFCSILTTNMNTTPELLLIRNSDYVKRRIDLKVFDGMEDLKVLWIVRGSLPSFPPLRNLQTLALLYCHLNCDFDVIGELRTLMILDLRSSDIKRLPESFKNLSKLRVLNLTGCWQLQEFSPGVLSSLSLLEELYMWDSFSYWVVDKLGSAETTSWISQLEDEDAKPELVDMWKQANRLAVVKQESTTHLVSPLEEEESSSQGMNDLVDTRGNKETRSPLEEDLVFLYKKLVWYGENYLIRWAKSMDWRVGLLSELLSLSRLTTLEIHLPPVDIVPSGKLFHKLESFKIAVTWQLYIAEDLLDSAGNQLVINDLEASSLSGTEISSLLKKTKSLELGSKILRDPLNVLDREGCANLESLTLESCDSLDYLIDTTVDEYSTSSSVFANIKDFGISGAKRLQNIFHGELSIHVNEIIFHHLTIMRLKNLPTFTGISKCNGKGPPDTQPGVSKGLYSDKPSLFNHPKVVFPVLGELRLGNMPMLENIWTGEHSPNSFTKLTKIIVWNCQNLLHLVPAQIQNRLQTLEKIKVRNCSSLKEIFEEGKLTINEGKALVSQSDKIPSSISQSYEGMKRNDIKDFKQSCQGFHNLTRLNVEFCDSLRFLLYPSIARGLVKLKEIRVQHCRNMEAIVAADECEESADKTMLPQLSFLNLVRLPNLGNFSQGTYTFVWPLKKIVVKECKKMNKFCLGTLGIPKEVYLKVRYCGENLEQDLKDSMQDSESGLM